jgi:aspartate aminotransferase
MTPRTTVLSRRGQLAPRSPIRKLEPLARAALDRGRKIYHLNIGQPDIPTPEPFLRAACLPPGQVLSYSPSAGLYPFRKALCAHYRRIGLPVDEPDLLVTTGGSEALLFTILALCDAGDEVITPEPFYPNYRMFTMMAGAEVRPLPTRIEEGFRLPGIDAFRQALSPRTRAVLLCNPSNPTGALYSEAALREVVALCRERGLVLIADEVYREFVYGGERPRSVLSLPGAEEVTVIVDSLSKRFSACGARVGCLVSKLHEVIDAATRFAMSRLSPPTLGQLGGTAVLEDPSAFIAPMISEFARRRDVLAEELRRLPGVVAPEPQGAFYLMARLPVDDSDRFCEWLLTDFERDGETVMLAPGAGFYSTPGSGRDEVRIAYVLGTEPLRHAVRLLGEALQRYPGRR